jgi:hypothetical protein
MDEVKAMTKAGETVGKAVGTGLHAMRVQTTRASRTGSQAAVRAARQAEVKLAERGIEPRHYLQELLNENVSRAADQATATTRRARKRLAKQRQQLAKQAGSARADLVRNAKKARKEAAKQAAEARKRAKQAKREYSLQLGRRRRRRWPWVLGLLFAGAGAVGVALSRRPQEVQLADVSEEPGTVEHAPPQQRGPAAQEGRLTEMDQHRKS